MRKEKEKAKPVEVKPSKILVCENFGEIWSISALYLSIIDSSTIIKVKKKP